MNPIINFCRLLSVMVLITLFSHTSLAQSEEDSTTQTLTSQEEYQQWAQSIMQDIEPQFGQVKLPGAIATLDIPSDFYYLNPQDSQTVLEKIWGNPPGQPVLGMLFPMGKTALDSDAWAVTIEYEEDGYVSDEDANDIDYSDLLKDMQADARSASEARVSQGYSSIELLGWAAQPYYDATTHKMYWAKELKFGDSVDHVLNYNIRILGRKGVLILNFIADIDQKYLIESKLEKVLAIAEFDQGSQYSDFDPELDEIAAYGLGALVAGKVIAKTGFFVMALLFLKKFGVIFLIAGAALLKRLFSKKNQANNQ